MFNCGELRLEDDDGVELLYCQCELVMPGPFLFISAADDVHQTRLYLRVRQGYVSINAVFAAPDVHGLCDGEERTIYGELNA